MNYIPNKNHTFDSLLNNASYSYAIPYFCPKTKVRYLKYSRTHTRGNNTEVYLDEYNNSYIKLGSVFWENGEYGNIARRNLNQELEDYDVKILSAQNIDPKTLQPPKGIKKLYKNTFDKNAFFVLQGNELKELTFQYKGLTTKRVQYTHTKGNFQYHIKVSNKGKATVCTHEVRLETPDEKVKAILQTNLKNLTLIKKTNELLNKQHLIDNNLYKTPIKYSRTYSQVLVAITKEVIPDEILQQSPGSHTDPGLNYLLGNGLYAQFPPITLYDIKPTKYTTYSSIKRKT